MAGLRAELLEQVFVERRGGGFELLLVLESEAGARERVTLTAPPALATDERAAVTFAIRWLLGRGGGLARLVRVRRSRAGKLEDAPELRQLVLDLVAAFDREDEAR